MAGMTRVLLGLALLLGVCLSAQADVVSGLYAIGTSLGASAASAVTVGAFVVSTAISIVSSAYAASQQKKKARQAAARQFQQDVANLRDRTVTLIQSDAPPATIYGEPAPVAGALAMALPHGLATEYKSLIFIFAGHESTGFDDVYIDGEALGIPAGGGWCTNTNFHLQPEYAGDMSAGPAVKVSYHLSPGGVDTADADLVAAMNAPIGGFPDMQLYTEAHKLSGYTYIVMTLNLFFERFQGGLPNVTVKLKGKPVYDPRTGLTVYSRNPALCLVDFLRSEPGYSAAIEQIDMNAWIAAANACDEEVYSDVDAVNYGGSKARYVCDGMFRADQDRDATRGQLEEAMAGFALESAGVWRIQAGAWSTPVMALTDEDMLAPTAVVQTVNPTQQRYNGARGTYVNAAGNGVSEDFIPYSNAVFLGLDGRPKPMDLPLPFTGSHMRCHQIARVKVERSRGGFTIRIHPKMKAWHLQPGDRIAVSSALFAFTNKTFIVRDWTFSRSAPLTLLCEEDVPATYDLADEVLADATPNSDLLNPFLAPPAPSGLMAESGPDQALNQDGVLVPRVKVSWEPASDSRVTGAGGAVRVQWRRLASADPWQTQDLPGDTTATYLYGVVARETYQIRVRFQTAWASGSFATINHTVLDNFSAPGAVSGLELGVEPDGVYARWDLPSDLPPVYWGHTEISIGDDYEDAVQVWAGRALQVNLGWMQAGVRTVWAVHFDVIGRKSPPIAAAINILAPAQPIVTAEVWREQVELTWTTSQTTQPLRGYEVRVGDILAEASLLTTVDSLGYAHTQTEAGTHMYWVVAIDRGGNRSAAGYVEVEVLPTIDAALDELREDLDDAVADLLTLQSDAATALIAKIDAISFGTRPNLLPNGSFEHGLEGWTADGVSVAAFEVLSDVYGSQARLDPANAAGTLWSPAIPARPGDVLSLSGDIAVLSAAGKVRIRLEFLDADGDLVGQSPWSVDASGDHPFSDDAERVQKFGVGAVVPASTVTARAAVEWRDFADGRFAVRRFKIEHGDLPATAYTDEATQSSTYAAVVEEKSIRETQTGGLLARWGVRVESNGHVSGVLLNNDGAESNFIVQADRFAWALPGEDGEIKYPVVFGTVGGVPSFGFEGNMFLDGTFKARMIDADQIYGIHIRADEIEGGHLKAGAITTREINVGTSSNLVPDAGFMFGHGGTIEVSGTAQGWSTGYTNAELSGTVFTINGAGADWHPIGTNALAIYQPNNSWNSDQSGARYMEHVSARFPVVGGKRHEFYVYTGAHRCSAIATLVYWDAVGTYLGEFSSDVNDAEKTGGKALSGYKRIGGFGTAPANAASADLRLRKRPTKPGETNSYLFATLPYVGEANPYQTEFSPWAPNGQSTRILPSGVYTPYLSALAADVGQISMVATGGATSYIRSNTKWWDDGAAGFVLAREGGGASFVDMLAGACRFYMHSTGTAGFRGPGFDLNNGGITISQANVINTLQIAGNAVTVPAAAGFSTGLIPVNGGFSTPQAGVFGYDSGGSPIFCWVSVQTNTRNLIRAKVYRGTLGGELLASADFEESVCFQFQPPAGATSFICVLERVNSGDTPTLVRGIMNMITTRR